MAPRSTTTTTTSAAPSWWERFQASVRPAPLAADLFTLAEQVRLAAAAGGAAVDAVEQSIPDLWGEFEEQEDRLQSFVRWGTVAFIALVVVVVVVVGAWFLAPARAALKVLA